MSTDFEQKPSAAPSNVAPSARKSRRARAKKTGKTTAEVILAAAQVVFAKAGYDGASVERISKQAKCNESLLYYHFGSKDGLFSAVLENTYRKLAESNAALEIDLGDPVGALSQVVLNMWDYCQKNPDLFLILTTENLLKGKHLGKSVTSRKFLSPAITQLRHTIERGIEQGIFRADIDVDELYITSMALACFYLLNRYTLSALFGRDLMEMNARDRWGEVMVHTILRTAQAT
jgi:AcrR family transcriptional regulator